MEISLRYIIQKDSHSNEFNSLYDVVPEDEVRNAIGNLPDSSIIRLTLPLVDIDERDYPEIEHWFKSYADTDFYDEQEIFGWDIDELVADVKAAIISPDSDEIRIHSYFEPLNKAAAIEEYRTKMNNLLEKIEPLTKIDSGFLVMCHDVWYS